MPSSGINMSDIYGTSLSQGSKAQDNGNGELGASTTEYAENTGDNGNSTVMYAVGIIVVLVLMRLAYEFLE